MGISRSPGSVGGLRPAFRAGALPLHAQKAARTIPPELCCTASSLFAPLRPGRAELEALGLSGQRVAIDAQKIGGRSQLALGPLQGLPENGTVHLVQNHAVEIGNLATVQLIEEMT